MVFHLFTDKSLVLAMRFGSQGVRTLATMVLARLVAKEDYGRFELVLSIPAMLAAAGDFGITRSIAASHDVPDDKVRDTSLWLLVGLALVFGALAIAGGFYFDIAREDPRLRWIGVIVAGSFVVQNLQALQMALLARDLQFSRWAIVEVIMTIATVATGIAVAVAGGGIFALALQQLLAPLFGLMVTFFIKPLHWPRAFDRGTASRFFSFGWKIALFQWTNNVQSSVAVLGIGRMIGDLAVGVFGRATKVRDLIGYNLMSTFDLVLMPLYSRAKDDPPRLRDLLLRGSVGVSVFSAFGAAWLAAVATDLIRVFLGQAWFEVPELLQALSPGMAIQGLAYPSVVLSLALGQPLVTFRYALLNLVGVILALGALWQWGLLAFAIALSLSTIVPTMYAVHWAARTTASSLRLMFWRLTPILVEAAVVFAVMVAIDFGIRAARGQQDLIAAIVRVCIVSLAGLLFAYLLMAWLDRRNWRDITSLLLRPATKPIENV